MSGRLIPPFEARAELVPGGCVGTRVPVLIRVFATVPAPATPVRAMPDDSDYVIVMDKPILMSLTPMQRHGGQS